jgi:phytoene synthase
VNDRAEAAKAMNQPTNNPPRAETAPAPAGTGDAEALEHVRAMTRAAGSSFYWAMRILPPERRDAMFAIYAFCRDVDDITDGSATVEEKLAQLTAWRGEIDLVFAGTPRTMLARALVGPARSYRLEKADFLAIIDGMEMDVRGTVLAPPMDQLQLYCDRVAGAVGLLSVRVFGAEGDGVGTSR